MQRDGTIRVEAESVLASHESHDPAEPVLGVGSDVVVDPRQLQCCNGRARALLSYDSAATKRVLSWLIICARLRG